MSILVLGPAACICFRGRGWRLLLQNSFAISWQNGPLEINGGRMRSPLCALGWYLDLHSPLMQRAGHVAPLTFTY